MLDLCGNRVLETLNILSCSGLVDCLLVKLEKTCVVTGREDGCLRSFCRQLLSSRADLHGQFVDGWIRRKESEL